jgi:alpha-beta hydrolase superfamily lysophospholipase
MTASASLTRESSGGSVVATSFPRRSRSIAALQFRDECFTFETLRAAGGAPYGGADLGEVLATVSLIRDGDETGWFTAWRNTAERVHETADTALKNGHRVSAREAFLRASNYYRTAEFFRRENAASDTKAHAVARLSRQTFTSAINLMDRPVLQIDIPYGTTTLPGYLFLVDDSGVARPTVVYTNGYDSTAEESWFAIAAAALERGYNVLAYDGPGQGVVIREQGLVFRHDWEAVLTPVLDYCDGRAEIDSRAIALFGYSLGAYLVARAAAFDHRPAALILDDGIFDFHQAYVNALPGWVMRRIRGEKDGLANRLMGVIAALRTQARWGLNNGVWTMGASSYADFIRCTTDYTLDGLADRITAPTLIMDAEEDQFLKGQPSVLAKAMTAPTTFARFTTAEGLGEHCHVASLTRAHQVIFDWLDTTISAGRTAERNGATTAPARP